MHTDTFKPINLFIYQSVINNILEIILLYILIIVSMF